MFSVFPLLRIPTFHCPSPYIFFTLQRSALLSAYLYQKDERAQSWKFRKIQHKCSVSFRCYGFQHSTVRRLTFFTLQRSALLSVYLYQKDKRAKSWKFHSRKFFFSNSSSRSSSSLQYVTFILQLCGR